MCTLSRPYEVSTQAGYQQYQQQSLVATDGAGLQLPEDKQGENEQADHQVGHRLSRHVSSVRCSRETLWPGRQLEQPRLQPRFDGTASQVFAIPISA